VTSTAIKHTNKRFLSWLGDSFLASLLGLNDGFGLDG
jgi:hypothetical protein